MNIKSLLFTISILGTSCVLGGLVAQAYSINLSDVEPEIGAQITSLNSLPKNERDDLHTKQSKQMHTNKTQISQLEQQLTQIKNTLNHLMLAQKNEPSNIYQPEVTEEEIITGVTVEEPVEDRQFVDHFASYLTNEVSSSDDDQESTSKIEQSFETELESRKITGVSLLSSECKATLCKIELGFDDEATRERYSNMGTSIVPWNGQTFFHQSETDPNNMIYYVAKEGFELVMPES